MKKGVPEQEAFHKTTAELGDISALAEEISFMYMGTRKYLTPKRTAVFVLGGAAVCFGLITGAITWFSTGAVNFKRA